MDHLINIRQATKEGYIAMCNGGVADLSYPSSKLRRARVQEGGGYNWRNHLQRKLPIQNNII